MIKTTTQGNNHTKIENDTIFICKQPVDKSKTVQHDVDERNPAPPGMYKNPANTGIDYLSTDAGFLPSTVCLNPGLPD